MNTQGLYFYDRQQDKDKNWSYALPENIYKQILMHDIDSKETELLFEILSEQISLFTAPQIKGDEWELYSDYEKDKSNFRRNLMYSTETIQRRLIQVVDKLKSDKRYAKYHHLLLSDIEFDDDVLVPAKIFTQEHREKLLNKPNNRTKSVKEREKYELIRKVDLNHDFLINSVSIFKGYYYVGSDDIFHYFTAKWDLKKDIFFKFSKNNLIVNEPFRFGQNVTKVSLIQSNIEFGHDKAKNKLYKVK